jgi:hypothetical protein
MKTKKYQMGGMPTMPAAGAMPAGPTMPARRSPQEEEEERRRKMAQGIGMKKGGMAEMKMMKKEGRGMAKTSLQKHASMPASKAHKGLKKGGSVDGCATKGKTKGKMVKMAMGGKAC